MNRRLVHAASCLAVIAAAFAGSAGLSYSAAAWPPAVTTPTSTVALSPTDELKTIVMAPGFHASLAASEPALDNPTFMTWDFDGRLWVIEYPPYMADGKIDGSTMFEPRSRVSVLESTKGDGVFDKKTVFADGLVLPRSVLVVAPGEVLVHEPDGVFLMKDTNGDLKADTKERVASAFGAFKGDVEHTGNGLFWGMDNVIYNSEIGLAFKWKAGKLTPILAASSGQYGVTQDDYGRIYRETNSSAPNVSYVSDTYFARNPIFSRKRGIAEWIGGPSRDANVVWPIRPTRGENRAYSDNYLRADGTARELTSAGAPFIYRGSAMPDVEGNIFTSEPSANLIVRYRLTDNGSGLTLRRAYEKGEFMASTDERFRPVYMTTGPDGALYVADMYTGVIQGSVYITQYLANYIRTNKLDNEYGVNGRIFRVVQDGAKLASPSPALSKATPQQLVDALASPDGWRRDMAQRRMVAGNIQGAAPLLGRLLLTTRNPLARIHALWTLDGLDAVTPAQALAGLRDPSRDVRVAAIRISERWLGDPASPVTRAVFDMIGATGNDWAVQQQLAASAGAFGDSERVKAILAVCDAYGGDYVVLDAALSGLKPADLAPALTQLLAQTAGQEWSQAREQTITSLTMGLFRTGSAAQSGALLTTLAAPQTPAWQRTALLLGGEVVLLGTRDPGLAPALPTGNFGPQQVPGDLGTAAFTAFVQATNAANNTGNAAFNATYPQTRLPPGALRSLQGSPTIVLTAEPTTLTALANATTGDARIRTRLKALLESIVWPGKPGYTPG
ncbi:MAG: Membrane-bound dehydrogenase domain protein [Caulobacteraceae bacterium]|nr:Membrane-bound dehydrogenase domain protein [Caulobacteraceae bacterium]